jgi:lysozyme
MMNAHNVSRRMKYDINTFINKLRLHEGLELYVYQDTLGIDTIGIGRNLQDRGISKEELDYMDIPNIEAVYEHGISERDAYYLATNDIAIVENELARAKPCVYDLDAVRQLIVMDMAFNMGVPRLCKFKKMWAAIEVGDFDTASVEMLDSRWARQVKSRATKLSDAMKKGEFV